MANLLAAGSAWRAAMKKQNASIAVTLRRAGYADVSILATPGTTTVLQETGDGSSSRYQTNDYIVKVSDYKVAGVVTEPRVGDLIIDTLDGTTKTYEVRPDAGESHCRHCDEYRNQWRIHTKLIEKPAAVLDLNQLRAILDLAPIPYGSTLSENDLRNNLGIVTHAA